MKLDSLCGLCNSWSWCGRPCPNAPVAQRKERPASNGKVEGSNPSGLTKYEKVKAWRKSHPAKYRSYMRSYMKAYRERLKTTI